MLGQRGPTQAPFCKGFNSADLLIPGHESLDCYYQLRPLKSKSTFKRSALNPSLVSGMVPYFQLYANKIKDLCNSAGQQTKFKSYCSSFMGCSRRKGGPSEGDNL